MSSYLFLLVFFLLISRFQINLTPISKSDNQVRSLIQFANMIRQTLGISPLNYNGYGCWCGLGGNSEPVDGTDACCKAHDQCYDNIIKSRKHFLLCSPYFSIYNWDSDSNTSLPICKDKFNSCGYHICECDRIVTECYKANLPTYNKSLKCLKN